MKKVLFTLLFSIVPLFPGTVEYSIIGQRGPTKVYRGFDAHVSVHAQCVDNRTVSAIDTGTNVWTSAGHGFTTGQTVKVSSSETIPSPFAKWGFYTVTKIDDDTFRLNLAVVSAGSGTVKVGRWVSTCGESGNDNSVYLSGTLPSGVTTTLMFQYNDARSSPMTVYSGGTTEFSVRFSASSTAELGIMTQTVEMKTNPSHTVLDTSVITIEVADVPTTAFATPSSYPAVPGKVSWEQQMTYIGGRWCRDKAAPTETWDIYNFSQAWFYDGAWAYYQVADYTEDPEWNNCGRSIAAAYRDEILTRWITAGNPRSYTTFTDGLKRSGTTCDLRYKTAITTLAPSSGEQLGRVNPAPYDEYIRETAFILETMITNERVTGTRHAWLVRAAEHLMGMIDNHFIQANPMFIQPFMDGLALRALILYWELTGDPRVPHYVKTALDGLWDSSWNEGQKGFYYNPDPWGPTCTSDCQNVQRSLNMLIAPAYAWYWSITADDTYRERGDKIFQYACRNAPWIAHADNDTYHAPGHPFSNGDHIEIHAGYVPGHVPNPNQGGGYIVNATTDTFRIARTPGGSAENLTEDGSGFYWWKIFQDFTATAAGDTFTCTAHGIKSGQYVWFYKRADYNLPGGVSEYTARFAVNVTADTFQVSTTPGGTPIDLTSDGGGKLSVTYGGGTIHDAATIIESGKEFSQNFRWSFDYLAWREGRAPNRP